MEHEKNHVYRTSRKRSGGAVTCLLYLLALVLFLGLAFGIWRMLSGGHTGGAAGSRAIVLDDAWSAAWLSDADTETQQGLIDAALDTAKSWGADTVLWTARAADGTALFRDKTKDGLSTADTVTANDSFFHKFDPLDYMVEAASARGMSVALIPTSADGGVLTAANIESLCAPGVRAAAKVHQLSLAAPDAVDTESILTTWSYTDVVGQTTGALLRCDASPARLVTALEEGRGNRAILGSYTALSADSTPATMLRVWHSDSSLVDLSDWMGGKTVSQTLALSYPGGTVYSQTCFLMGTSDPSLSLNLRGGTVGDTTVDVPRYGTLGVWGYLVSLSVGENVFTLAQPGGESLTFTVTRATASSSSANPTPDGSAPALWGQKVQVSSGACASALSDYTNADSITETLYEGAVVSVYDSVRFQRGSRYTYAYKLANGDYLLSQNVTLLDPDTPDAVFTGMTEQEDAETNCTVLTFAGSGTPAVYHTWDDNALALTFYSAGYTGAAPATGNFITSAEVTPGEFGFTLALTFAPNDPLYGWFVQYDREANTTSVWLKHTPVLSDAETGPLTGVRVLLDAGHGADDNGAMGSAGFASPVEKDTNLAETMATGHRLTQLGATVLYTRTDDSFPTLDDRLNMVNEVKPDFFLALHHNSAALTGDINGSGGVECYWFYTEGKPLAKQLVQNLSIATDRSTRGVFYNYFYVTRTNICPAVLLESGFMTDPAEYENCISPENIWSEAGAIAQSVLECVSGVAYAESADSAPAK